MTDPYAGIGAEDPYSGIGTVAPSRKVQSFDVVNGQKVPTGSPEAKAAYSDYPGRTAALYARSAGEGVANTFAAPHDLGVGLQNLMRRGLNWTGIPQAISGNPMQMEPTWSSGLSQALTQSGAPTPQTQNEQTGTAVTRGVTGALTGGGLFGAANPSLATTGNIVRTGISGATGAAAGEGVRRAGYGPVTQFVASLLGGAIPFVGSAFSRAAQSGAPSAAAPPTASANASVGEGEASAEQTLNATPEATATGGGSGFGEVGPNPSAGLTEAQQRALEAGQRIGMRGTPGTVSGDKSLQQFEAKLESQPLTSGPFFELKDANQRVLNRVTAASIGETTDYLDSVALGRAADRLGDVFEGVRSPNRIVQADPQATTKALDAIDQDMEGLLPNNGSIRDNPLVKTLETTMQKGGANGQQLGSLSSKLGRAAWKQMSSPSGDRDLGQALYAVKDHVDDLVQSTLAPDEATAYAQARQQYRNLMLITGRTGIINPSSGNVSGVALANRLQQADKAGFLYGKNQSDWYNAARFAQAFKPIVGDSGTATRSMITNPVQLVTRVPINMATRAYLRSPAANAQAAARGINATQSAINAPKGLLNPLVIPGAGAGLMGSDNR